MAGWTFSGTAKSIDLYRGNPDGGQKVANFPALASGNVGWWQDFCHAVELEFARRCKSQQTNVATLLMSANNSTGDVTGVGTLTITLTTT